MPIETQLLKDARERGCRTLDGAAMVALQAAGSLELFTGARPDRDRMLDHVDELIAGAEARRPERREEEPMSTAEHADRAAATRGRRRRRPATSVGRARAAGARAAAQADRPERDPGRRRGRQRRVHPVPLHRLARPGWRSCGPPSSASRSSSSSTWRSSATRSRPARRRSPASQRLWKPWGLILVLLALLATSWPGWATSAATVATFAFGGGDPNVIADRGAARDRRHRSPPRRSSTRPSSGSSSSRSARCCVFIVVALFAAISATAYSDTSQTVTSFGAFPGEIELAILVGALAAAGAGGANNLVQSNWIRDKGFGMGRYAPRIVSPITGEEEAAPSGQCYRFPRRRAEHGRAGASGGGGPTSSSSSRSRVIAVAVDHRLLADRLLDRVRQPRPAGRERLRLHLARGRRARRAGRRLVRHAVPRDRRGQPVRRRAGDRRLRLAPRRRRRAGRLHGRQRALDREPRLLHRRVDDDRVRHARSCWPASTSRSCW